MNYLIITIDALSKWYIDNIKEENSFFSYLEKATYSFSNAYSLGPFTEAAVRGFWAGDNPLDGYSYLSESRFKSKTLFEKYSQTHYMYYGKLVPYFNYKIRVDNQVDRERCEERAFEHIWSARMKYYCNLYKNGDFSFIDMRKIKFILREFFCKYDKSDYVAKEKECFEIDEEKYINDILQKGEKSCFYLNLTNNLVIENRFRNIRCIEKQREHELLLEEAVFLKKAKDKNIELAISNRVNSLEDIESILEGERNRCIMSNNDLLAQMRDESEVLPKLREEIDEFLQWYDNYSVKIDTPFFAYIHNYDFHFPENFMNSRIENYESYKREVKTLTELLHDLKSNKISVSKQLSLKNIERNLAYMWKELEKRNVFEDTCVIITADHGISNFMNPVKKSDSRWNYTRTNFNIPMYIKAPRLKNQEDSHLICSNLFAHFLDEVDNEDGKVDKLTYPLKEYLFTSWMNGIPEIDRNVIKIGIRNLQWSITCQGYYCQSFSSLSIVGIYNLVDDPDEINCIPYSAVEHNLEFVKLFNQMGRRWYELIIDLLQDELAKALLDNIKEIKDTLLNNKKLFSLDNRIDRKKFAKSLSEKRIILYGCNLMKAFELLKNVSSYCRIIEIWCDSDCEDAKYMGYKCTHPHEIDDEDVVILVCDVNELNCLKMLNKMKINNFIFCSSVIVN